MNWPEYVAFTATTALPAAQDPAYLRLGVMEEAFECLAAYANLQAAIHGRVKRTLRGDSEAVLQAKEDAAIKARAQLVEELGDLAWYVARMSALSLTRHKLPYHHPLMGLGRVAYSIVAFEESSECENAMRVLVEFLALTGLDLSTVLSANVAKLTARKSAGTLKGEGTR